MERKRVIYLLTLLYVNAWLKDGRDHCFGVVVNNRVLPELQDLRVAGVLIIDGNTIIFAGRTPKMSPRQSADWVTLMQVAKRILERGYITARYLSCPEQ